MRISTSSKTGRLVLMTSHCAGMIDMVALPLWVGTLTVAHHLDPQQAGGVVTLFLLGAVTASLFFAPRFNRLNGRTAAMLGFALCAICFFGAAVTEDFALLATLHFAGGLAAGCSLSFTHGTIGRSANPQRLFGMVGMALGVFAVAFLAITPQLIGAYGGAGLFGVLGAVMTIASLLAAAGFPTPDAESHVARSIRESGAKMPGAAWLGVVAVGSMALVQAMVFSFVERMGIDRGFGVATVTTILVCMGVLNMFPGGLAALLEHRLNASTVLMLGPLVQASLAVVIVTSSMLMPFAFATSVFVAVMLFTHTFAFGTLARLDPTGRCTAATPAMVMIGSAIGPILGGTLVKIAGYHAIGGVAITIDMLALICFWRVGIAMSRRVGTGIHRPA